MPLTGNTARYGHHRAMEVPPLLSEICWCVDSEVGKLKGTWARISLALITCHNQGTSDQPRLTKNTAVKLYNQWPVCTTTSYICKAPKTVKPRSGNGTGWLDGKSRLEDMEFELMFEGWHFSYTANVQRYHTTTILRPFFRDHPGEPVPEENFWTLWCKGRLTEADSQTIQLGATPSGLSSAHLHHPHIFYRPDALPAAQPTVSKQWRQDMCRGKHAIFTKVLYILTQIETLLFTDTVTLTAFRSDFKTLLFNRAYTP